MMSTPDIAISNPLAGKLPDNNSNNNNESPLSDAVRRQNIEDIVTALVDKKQRDLKTLRRYLGKNSSLRIERNISMTRQTSLSKQQQQQQHEPNGSSHHPQKQVTTTAPYKLQTVRGIVTSTATTRRGSKAFLPSIKPKKVTSSGSFLIFHLLRCILLDLPLATLFLSLVFAHGLRLVHDQYFVPLVHRAKRTDEHLMEEFTYYDRTCTATDVTTRNISDLVVVNNSMMPIPVAVDQMMTHGALLIPRLLPLNIVQELRAYIVDRNEHLSELESIPLSQGEHRVSFAVDATEHAIVTRAVEHVARHPILQPLVEQLVSGGSTDDPAVTEITAITAHVGCIDQVWHPDVKQDGNAAKYARTYSHSYSLFIPLQDTTHEMGATDVCPGTHYCSNNLIHVCEANKLSLSQSSSSSRWNDNRNNVSVWKAGDAALLNQQVWHRGASHQDPHAKSRVVFIMSFMARPTVDDPRQLSRGTYFHMRWNMWGHTWQDLMDAHDSMIQPFSTLRCLRLWKPSADRHWGYDLITASILRMANHQLGMQADDLRFFVEQVMDKKLYYPRWLKGPLPKDDYDATAWQVYIRETIYKAVLLLRVVNAVALCLYILCLLILVQVTRRTTMFATTKRLPLMYGVIMIGFIFTLECFQRSDWSVNVKRGRWFHRPFPSTTTNLQLQGIGSSGGPTTLPNRADVLVGSRYDTEFLGSYNRWLDFHPGNVAFQFVLSNNAPFYQSYSELPKSFREHVLNNAVSHVTERNDRFLEQEPSTGDWRIMSLDKANKYAQLELTTFGRPHLLSLLRTFRFLAAYYRFGKLRQTRLASVSLTHLTQLQEQLLVTSTINVSQTNSTLQARVTLSPFPVLWHGARPKNISKRNSLLLLRPRVAILKNSPHHENVADNLRIGDVVMCNYEGRGTFSHGSIANVWPNGLFDVAYTDGEMESNVDRSLISKYVPITEGDLVEVYQQQNEGWHKGLVTRVMPNGDIHVIYDNGEDGGRIEPQYYRKALYAHSPV